MRVEQAGAILAGLLALCVAAAEAKSIESTARGDASSGESGIRWEPFTGAAFDGSPLDGQLGRIRVPENRRSPTGRTIELAFVRYRTSRPNPGPPIVFLAGGPGASGVEHAAATATHPQMRLLEHADVIGLDQRGTGKSVPNLTDHECVRGLPADRAIDRAETLGAFEAAVRDCVGFWRRRGVDLAAYDSVESAEDVESLRRALGVERLVLFGSSYGSHLGLAYLRRHSDRVERALLTKVEGPDHTWKLPSTVQRHLGDLARSVTASWLASELPDLLATVRDLLRRLDERPVTLTVRAGTPEETRVTVGPFDLQTALARALGSSPEIARIPAALLRFARDDWSEDEAAGIGLAVTALENRRVAIQAMTLMMDCASGGSAARLARIELERRDEANLLADAIHAPMYPEACRAIDDDPPDLGDAFRGPLTSPVPVLFVSGSLDARTPPENVEAIRGGFAHHAHVVVLNAGHESRELMSEEYRHLMQSFLRGEPVESTTITLPSVRFQAASPDRNRPLRGAS